MNPRRSRPNSMEMPPWRLFTPVSGGFLRSAAGSTRGVFPVLAVLTLSTRISSPLAAETSTTPTPASPLSQFSSLTQPSGQGPVTTQSPAPTAAAGASGISTTPIAPTSAIIPFSEPSAEPAPAAETTDSILPPSTDADIKPARTAALNTSVLPEAPSGFSGGAPSFPLGGTGEGILEGFTLAANMSGRFDTNITQSPGEPIAPIEQDYLLSAGATLNYVSSATDWTFGGNYAGSYDSYFNNDQFSGYNQGAGLAANYNGTRLSVTASASADLDRGANRYYNSADFVERTSANTRINARYKLSPKTTMQGNIGGSLTSSGGGSYSDTSSFDLGASGLWKYSPLTEFGPGLRYTFRSGSSQLDRSSLGPTLTVNYKLSKKVALNSRVGVDFAQYEDGTTADPTFSASIGINYQASKLWGMNLSFYRDTQADPSIAGAYQDVGNLRLGYSRKVQRARLNLGMSLESNTTEFPGDSSSSRPSRDYFSLDGSIGMPIFGNTTYASIFTRYNQRSGSASDTWDSVQAGFSISRSF